MFNRPLITKSSGGHYECGNIFRTRKNKNGPDRISVLKPFYNLIFSQIKKVSSKNDLYNKYRLRWLPYKTTFFWGENLSPFLSKRKGLWYRTCYPLHSNLLGKGLTKTCFQNAVKQMSYHCQLRRQILHATQAKLSTTGPRYID